MKNWMALLTFVAAISLGSAGCSSPENEENKVDPTIEVDEGVTATPDPSAGGDGVKKE